MPRLPLTCAHPCAQPYKGLGLGLDLRRGLHRLHHPRLLHLLQPGHGLHHRLHGLRLHRLLPLHRLALHHCGCHLPCLHWRRRGLSGSEGGGG